MTRSIALRLGLSLPGVAFLMSCGGGEGGSTGPTPVARVDVTAPNSTLEVGQTMQLSVQYFDAQSVQLGGRTVSWSSSSQSVATVSGTGLVTAVGPGSATLSAVVDGVAGHASVSVVIPPVVSIVITPPSPQVNEGATIALSAQPRGPSGQALNDRTVTWSSANTARATVSSDGVVTGVTPGYVYIRATADGRTDSTNLRVRSLTPPVITSATGGEVAPGGAVTLTGNNFAASIGGNAVFVNGVQATVTTASTTSVDFTIPAKSALPCSATGPAQVLLVANSDSATTSITLRVATAHTLAVGESLLLTTPADLLCNELLGSGGRYLFTAFNYASNAGILASFRVPGSIPSAAAVASVPAEALTAPVAASPPSFRLPDDPMVRHLRAHATFMAQDRALVRPLGSPQLPLRAKAKPAAARTLALVPPPQVGDIVVYRMRRTLNTITNYDEVDFRVVYSGAKILLLEDPTAPLAGTMDDEYQQLGLEFDNVMFPQLAKFGDLLVADDQLDDNGRIVALFTPRVNEFEVNGVANQVLGFVSLCDFFPRTQQILPGDDGQLGTDDDVIVQHCQASNEGETFYALVPDPSVGWTIDFWLRLIRGTLIHEAKHITSYAWRYFLDASQLEEVWLEEATAQEASEMWARTMYQAAQKQDIGWNDGPNCDYDFTGCPDAAEGILHHFSFLYAHYEASETKSILDDPFGSIDQVIYGSSWSFIRYVTDLYGATEQDFLSALIEVQNDRGVANVAGKAGAPFSELLGWWSLASLADNYPGVNLADPKLRLPSWNTRDLFENMSAFLRSGGEVIFPKPWPLQVRQVPFGTFSASASTVTGLKGGGFIAWELSGNQTGPQSIAIRSSTGGQAPASVGLALVRIQ